MEKKDNSRRFLFVGNQLCLDFINTEMIVNGKATDLFDTAADFLAWLTEARVLTASDAKEQLKKWTGSEASQLLDQARHFRTVIRRTAERIVSGKAVQAETVETINHVLKARAGYAQIVRVNGRFERRFQAERSDASSVLVPIAEAASELLCSGDLSLVKKCRNAGCILYFYDTTKNRTRQWCSMSICGNRMKVAAHYRRKRSEGR
jgi:predicted RNA-binding Zn ribbon-like protein